MTAAGTTVRRGYRKGDPGWNARRRAVREGTPVEVEIVGLSGIYSDPRHVIAYGVSGSMQ
jgi:hypothetical protein